MIRSLFFSSNFGHARFQAIIIEIPEKIAKNLSDATEQDDTGVILQYGRELLLEPFFL